MKKPDDLRELKLPDKAYAAAQPDFAVRGIARHTEGAARFVQESPLPVILAGGLTPVNVVRAIERVRPYAVDVNTGVKTPADRTESAALCRAFNRETKNGRDMRRQAHLLKDAVGSIIDAKAESDIDSFFGGGTTSFLENDVEGLDDFELVCFLAVRPR